MVSRWCCMDSIPDRPGWRLDSSKRCLDDSRWLWAAFSRTPVLYWFWRQTGIEHIKRITSTSVLGQFGTRSLRSFFKGPKWPETELTKDWSALTTLALRTDLSSAKYTMPKDNKRLVDCWACGTNYLTGFCVLSVKAGYNI